jgi:hypothetical protein
MEYSVIQKENGDVEVVPSFAVLESDEVLAVGTYEECREFAGLE